ncbi:phosphonate ABC transporter ATP-binding protein [Blastopirellula marina]|uniref:phosphonate ABC transporter ATP-binding protein n=1 Tax=Blastopirellula marina TaxID=124 RepID=UPI001304E8B5|nr:ATP-binding cassette domain-containing protein [Blastopirellula marina]
MRAVQNVSLEIERGEFCVMLGHSGAGKSTLLKLISGQIDLDEGQITIDGQPLSRRNRRQLQHRIGMVHQHFELVERLSCLDNVMLGCLPWVPWRRSVLRNWNRLERAAACHWLQRVGLEPGHASRPAGQISGGQQQRVAIARALIRRPSLILADEPVASLDPQTGRSILTLLRDAAHQVNIAVLCNLHQPEMAQEFADRIIELSHGKLQFDGTPAAWSCHARGVGGAPVANDTISRKGRPHFGEQAFPPSCEQAKR